MLKKIIFLISCLVTAAHGMDNAVTQELTLTAATQAVNKLPEWVQKAAAVTVILERGYFTDTKVTLPIDDDTNLLAIYRGAVDKLADFQLERGTWQGPLTVRIVACYPSTATLYLYSHQSNPLKGTANVKKVMAKYNTDIFALVKTRN